ncbi:hypothetical protein [Salarchaeum sp. JOR-1]|uniref:hypothetical protein n=1 Tax=Salarchaeum sp. JOR-1 TaxID=2599399 RepID=UPI0011983223|nr:hypothetical protein [Salarchaeum sp. JOR-1]QDX40695.1 hypothetical protein FQU85_07165 [Salarchaeum sp. JOR-1]
MRMRVLAVTALLVLAGCTAPTTDTTGTPTADGDTSPPTETTTDAAPDGPLAYDGATLPYDGPRVLDRVERRRGLNATGPIHVREATIPPTGERDVPDRLFGIEPMGAVALGLKTNATVASGSVLGVTYAGPRIVLRENVARYPQELVFAHELTHALQYQYGFTAVRIATSGLLDTDRALAVRGVVEGDAQVTALRYRNRYLSNAPRPVIDLGAVTRERWQVALSTAYYHYGYEYVRTTTDTPAGRNAVLRAPPNTTRALLHPGVNDTKPALADPPRTSGLTPVRYDTVGELGIRLALRANGRAKSAAARAAFGWRNDRMTYYADADAVHWRTAWQNESEAAAFAAAWRGLLDARNATERGGLLAVPATDTTPRFYTAIHTTDDRVTVVSGTNESAVRSLAQESSSRSDSSSSSTSSSETSDSASFSASVTARSP